MQRIVLTPATNEVNHTYIPDYSLRKAKVSPQTEATVEHILEGLCNSSLSNEDASGLLASEFLWHNLISDIETVTHHFFGADPENIYTTVHTETPNIRETLNRMGAQDPSNIKIIFDCSDSDVASLQTSATFFRQNTDLLPKNTQLNLNQSFDRKR